MKEKRIITTDYRYLVASLMLCSGVLGLSLGGIYHWLGVASFILVLILDVTLARDEATRSTGSVGLRNLVLYLPLPLIATIWLLFAQILADKQSTVLEIAGAMLSVAFLSALGGLPPSHELMHRSGRFARFYSSLYLTIFLLPMNDLGHVQGHHLNVATVDDYDTPRRGQTVYSFAFKSLWNQMLDSFKMEKQRLEKLKIPIWSVKSRFFQAVVTVSVWLGIWFTVAGIGALPLYLVAMAVFFLVLGGFNYTQHYGLIREVGQPIEMRHSWNQLKPLSRSLSFEISNHSEHHLAPTRAYTALTPYPDGPQMPSIVLCFLASFFPPVWERYFAKPRLALWDQHFASAGEKELATEANEVAGWGIEPGN